MKVRVSVKRMCNRCKVIRRRGGGQGDLQQPQAQAAAARLTRRYRE